MATPLSARIRIIVEYSDSQLRTRATPNPADEHRLSTPFGKLLRLKLDLVGSGARWTYDDDREQPELKQWTVLVPLDLRYPVAGWFLRVRRDRQRI